MTIRATWKVEGLRELGKALEKITEATRKRIMRRALRRAAAPIEATAKAHAPLLKTPDPRRKRGTLRNAIRVAGMRSQTGYDVALKVGVKRLSGKRVSAFKTASGKSAAENPDDPFYAHFVEFGTSKTAANPFLRPALHAHRHSAVNMIRDELKREIEAEARRQARKQRRR